MNRKELLLLEVEQNFDKEGWYPPLQQAIAGLTAEQASWKPAGEASHSVWEIVNHLLYYKERFLERLKGNDVTYTNDNDATFMSEGPLNEEAWQATVARVEAVHKGIYEILSAMKEEEFDRPFPQNPLGVLISNISMHDAHHTGQIIFIRKLQGSWPARRSFE